MNHQTLAENRISTICPVCDMPHDCPPEQAQAPCLSCSALGWGWIGGTMYFRDVPAREPV